MVDIEPSTDSLCFDGENRSQLDDSVTPFSLFIHTLKTPNFLFHFLSPSNFSHQLNFIYY